MTFKTFRYVCAAGHLTKSLQWDTDPSPSCSSCQQPTTREYFTRGESAFVIGDEIDVIKPHGVCHPDGTPRRFRSRAELAAAEKASGWRRLERGERFPKSEPRPPRPRVIMPPR